MNTDTNDKLKWLLTQYSKLALSEALGVSPTSIYRWLNGTSTPTGRTLNAINTLYNGMDLPPMPAQVPAEDGLLDAALKAYDPTAYTILTGQPLTTAELSALTQVAYKIALAREESRTDSSLA